MKKTIAVIYGGRSGEHAVSLVSAASVARTLAPSRYDVLLVGIADDGRWFLQSDAVLATCRAGNAPLTIEQEGSQQVALVPGQGKACLVRAKDGKALSLDCAFPVLHGTFGEDGSVQGLFEICGIPYVGAGVAASALGMDKDYAKTIWKARGLPVVPWIAINAAERQQEHRFTALLELAERDFRYPLFVKPSAAGSSVGAAKATDRTELVKAVDEALLWDDKVLVEPFLAAREIECSVTGNEELSAYTPGEVAPTHEFYDYDAKYIDPDGAKLIIPARIEEEDLGQIRELAKKAYRALGITGLSRVDFFVLKDSGEILLNEVNTLPGFTGISMFPRMCEASGLSYAELLDLVIDLGISRHTLRSARSYSR